MTKGEDIISIQIERPDIESLNFSPYLHVLENLVSDERTVFKFMHRCVFHINGYDLDPRYLAVIPEVERFIKELHQRWPYFLYFCAPMSECFAWWFGINYFPVVGREDGGTNFMEVDPHTYQRAMEEFYSHANGLAEKFNFPMEEYMERQSEMVDAINEWCLGRKV